MSIANLYGRAPTGPLYNNSDLASKAYIPGGVMLSSPLFTPAAGVKITNDAAGRKIKLFYTKIGNQVTISCKCFVFGGAAAGDSSDHFIGLAAVGNFSDVNLGPDIIAQLANDILVQDVNVAGDKDPLEPRIPGLFCDASAGGGYIMCRLRSDGISLSQTANPADVLVVDHQYYCGGVSFLSQNAAIVV